MQDSRRCTDHGMLYYESSSIIYGSTKQTNNWVKYMYKSTTLHCLLSADFQMQAAVNSGFRNSGISCGKKGKTMVVRQLAFIYHGRRHDL